MFCKLKSTYFYQEFPLLLGMVERSSNRVLLFPVDDRSSDTLIPLIKRYCEPGSRIYTDGWTGYCGLNGEGFEHFTCIHKYQYKAIYKNVATGEVVVVHTNTVEGSWTHSKRHFKEIVGTTLQNFNGHLAEVVWRNHHRGSSMLAMFFRLIAATYRVDDDVIDLNLPSNIFSTTFAADNKTHIINETCLEGDETAVDDEVPLGDGDEAAMSDNEMEIIDDDVSSADEREEELLNQSGVRVSEDRDETVVASKSHSSKNSTFWANIPDVAPTTDADNSSQDAFQLLSSCLVSDTESEDVRNIDTQDVVSVIPESSDPDEELPSLSEDLSPITQSPSVMAADIKTPSLPINECTTKMLFGGCKVHGFQDDVTDDDVPLDHCIDTVNENEVDIASFVSLTPLHTPPVPRATSTPICTSPEKRKRKSVRFTIDERHVTIRRRGKHTNIAAPANYKMQDPIVETRRRRPSSAHIRAAPSSVWVDEEEGEPKKKRRSVKTVPSCTITRPLHVSKNIVDPNESDLEDFAI